MNPEDLCAGIFRYSFAFRSYTPKSTGIGRGSGSLTVDFSRTILTQNCVKPAAFPRTQAAQISLSEMHRKGSILHHHGVQPWWRSRRPLRAAMGAASSERRCESQDLHQSQRCPQRWLVSESMTNRAHAVGATGQGAVIAAAPPAQRRANPQDKRAKLAVPSPWAWTGGWPGFAGRRWHWKIRAEFVSALASGGASSPAVRRLSASSAVPECLLPLLKVNSIPTVNLNNSDDAVYRRR